MRHNHIFMRFPEGRYKALTFSFDDGSCQDIWLVEKMREYGLKGTFNMNMGLLPPTEDFDFSTLDDTVFPVKQWQRRLSLKQMEELFRDSGMELATHGYLHAELPKLEDDALIWEIMQDRIALENITGSSVRGHAYAQGAFDDRVCSTLKKAGILYGRTVYFTGDFRIPTDLMRWAPTCAYNSENAFELADRFLAAEPNDSKYHPDTMPKLFYIFAHSYEFEVHNNFDRMDRLMRLLAGNEQVWYCTNIEYYRYAEAYARLDYDLSRTHAYNPSAIPVWIFVNGKTVKVPAGETVEI